MLENAQASESVKCVSSDVCIVLTPCGVRLSIASGVNYRPILGVVGCYSLIYYINNHSTCLPLFTGNDVDVKQIVLPMTTLVPAIFSCVGTKNEKRILYI